MFLFIYVFAQFYPDFNCFDLISVIFFSVYKFSFLKKKKKRGERVMQSYKAYCTLPYCTPCNTSHLPVHCICMRRNRIHGSHHSMLSHLISVEV